MLESSLKKGIGITQPKSAKLYGLLLFPTPTPAPKRSNLKLMLLPSPLNLLTSLEW